MKIFNMHFIQCIIIGLSLLLCIYPASAVNKTIVKSMVNESHITENWQEEIANNTKSHELFAVLNLTALIIAISAFVMVALPGAVGWYLYYKLRKKMAIHDVEKAMEDPQPVKFTSKISLRLSKNCFCNMFRLLCNRIKKRKTICDEESAIDKSQTTPKPSKPETITRNKDKKQKKKKDTMNKTVGEAMEMPSIQQETNEQVQTPALPKENKDKKKKKKDTINKTAGEAIEMPSVQQKPNEQVQTPALPKENKDKKQKKKKDTMNKTVGEATEMPSVQQETNEQVQTPALPKENKDKKKKKDAKNKSVGEAIEMLSVRQETDEQVQTPALPKENVCIVIQPEEQCMVPLADLSREQEHVPTENDLSMIQEHVAPDIVSVSPIIPEFQQPFVERQKETPASIARYKRTIIFTWIDEITDDEDEASTPQAEK